MRPPSALLLSLRGSLPSRRLPPSLRSQLAYKHAYSTSSSPSSPTIQVGEHAYPQDAWTNVPPHILSLLPRRLHLDPSHPLSITRSLIESRFPSSTYATYNTFSPVVSVAQNFDSLGFPPDHPGRSRTDTYYINGSTVLRTHTSAHQADVFRTGQDGFLISADVYRRDAIDRSHYPVFHQMEGARTWSRDDGDVARRVWDEIKQMPETGLLVEDESPGFESDNPLQSEHAPEEAEAVAAHLKRSLEGVVAEVFGRARAARGREKKGEEKAKGEQQEEEPLRVRWVKAYFPFTSPSWELEVFWQGDWLEVLGCGVVQHQLLANAGAPSKIGWAFGWGLERVAMLLFNIPDIRLFWSRDQRFLSQFSPDRIRAFVPFSRYPPCYKDVAFWLPGKAQDHAHTASAAGGAGPVFHENDMMEVVRDVAGDLAEDVKCTDVFVHPKTEKKSLCWRVVYRSLERTLTTEEANAVHERVRNALVERYGVELR